MTSSGFDEGLIQSSILSAGSMGGMRASGLADLAKVLHTTPDYLLGFEKDPFVTEAMRLLQGIEDEQVKLFLGRMVLIFLLYML